MSDAAGVLELSIVDEATGMPTPCRVELRRAGEERVLPIRGAVRAGTGWGVDRTVDVSLRDGDYRFRMVRGPEYRIIDGTFSLERLSDDAKTVALPRMVDMLAQAYVSGDALVAGTDDLPIRMAGEDLHVALVAAEDDEDLRRVRRAGDDPIAMEPLWIRGGVTTTGSLAFYGGAVEVSGDPTAMLLRVDAKSPTRVAVTRPFDWRLPVWLASGKIDGVFVLGDWLRTDRAAGRVANGRPVDADRIGTDDPGRWAEFIYHQILESGFEIAPMAGGGIGSGRTPIGYNRVYVAADEGSPIDSLDDWTDGMFAGRSMVTNGPLLRCRVNGQMPGHRFEIDGKTTLQMTLDLAVRDPVEYLDILHNGRVFYSAPLDEFARRGGRLPPIVTDDSGWIIARVVTKHADHYRVAMTAPWYIRAGGRRRINRRAVEFWIDWLDQQAGRLGAGSDATELQKRSIVAARRVWGNLLQRADLSAAKAP